MNVETLLEAAKFLELQEEQQRQREQASIKLTHPLQIHHHQQLQPHQQPAHQQNQQHQQHQQHQNHIQPSVTTLQVSHQVQPPPPPPTTTTVVPTLIRTKSESLPSASPRQQITNSFDIINPLVIDDSGEPKRKQPPIPFRTGTREVHNKLEKDRRAHLKECFDALKKQLPRAQDERKSSNLSILHSALRYIQSLKKKERDLEHEMESLARQKIANQQRLAVLRKDVGGLDGLDVSGLIPDIGSPICKDEDHKMDEMDEEKVLEKLPLPRMNVSGQNQMNGIKEGSSVQALSVVPVTMPVTYPMSHVVLQKVLVPKNLSELPVVSSPTVAHFITPQPLSGKVVPLVNAQYVVKPVVVVSTPSRPS